jgi:hypothetical protein
MIMTMRKNSTHTANGQGFMPHAKAMKQRSRAFREDADERVRRLRRLTPAQAAREMEALCSFPWRVKKTPSPAVPARRFLTA